MFCYQCEQARGNSGCEKTGVCGKPAEVGELHDVLFHVTLKLSALVLQLPAAPRAAYHPFIEDALFATVTNVNFDANLVEAMIHRGQAMMSEITGHGDGKNPGAGMGQAARDDLLGVAKVIAIPVRQRQLGADLVGLQEMLAYGAKGLAAIVRQARSLGYVSDNIGDYIVEAMAYLARPQPDAEELLALCLRCGEMAVEGMGLLDAGNTEHFGHPEPSEVRMGVRKGKAILVSGHELDDLERILLATAGTGINVYTHGEMMAAHGYPGLKRHAHLAGHHGGAWHDQHKVFAAFPGAIVMTGACLMPPRKAYRERLFTIGAMAYPDIRHASRDDLAAVLDCALGQPGFTTDAAITTNLIGFGRRSTLGAADILVDAVRRGDIRRFVLIGGCDGPTSGRDYYSRLAAALPQNWAVLTLGCGKFRVHGHVNGSIDGLPRLLDVGQCSDSFTAIKICQALSDGLGMGLSELPLSLVLSWHEQKAVTILLALLHLGLRNIRIGPRMPAFVSPAMLNILVEGFGLIPIGDVEQDIRAMAMSA